MERLAAEEDVEEVRRSGVVLVPLLDVDLHLVLRVLDVGEGDVLGDRLDRRLVADLVEHALEVDPHRLVDLVVRCHDGDLLTGRARLLDELLGLGEVRRRPLGARVLRVRAVVAMAGEAGRQDLARRRRELGTAEDLHGGVTVDRIVDGPPCLDVVERRQIRVHGHVPERRQRVDMHLVGVLRADLAEAVGRRRLERPVGLTVLDCGDLRLGRQTEGLGDLVRIPGRLRQPSTTA